MPIRIITAYFFMVSGAIFGLVTVIGLLRFPDVYTRMHAAAVVLTVSGISMAIGSAIYIWELFLSIKILFIGLLFLISNPMATHAIARASYRRKVALPQEIGVDEYADYLEED